MRLLQYGYTSQMLLALQTKCLLMEHLALFFISGLVGGLLALKIVVIGLFLVGAGSGASIGIYVQHIVLGFIDAPDYVPYVIVVLFAISGGIILLYQKENIFAVMASILGAFVFTQGWVYFAKYVNIIDLVDTKRDDTENKQFWAQIGSIVALSILGSLYQWGWLSCARKKNNDNSSPLME